MAFDFANFFGGLGSSAISGAFSVAAANQQYQNQRKLNQQAYDLTQQGYRESPTAQRQGLEAAGYNPILAAMNGASYGSYSGGSSSMASTPDFGSNFNTSRQAKVAERKSIAEIDNLHSASGSNNAQAELFREQANTQREQQVMLQLQQIKQDLDNKTYLTGFEAQLRNTIAQTQNFDALSKTAYMNARSQEVIAKANALNAKGSYYYNTHRALGFSESSSQHSNNGVGIGLKGVNYNTGGGSTYSRSW